MALEIPETAIIAGQMNHSLRGKQITHAGLLEGETLIREGFINVTPEQFQRMLTGRKIEYVTSNGKWIFVRLDSGVLILLSLQILGELRLLASDSSVTRQSTAMLRFDDESQLAIRIVGWGYLKLVPVTDLGKHLVPGKLGINPLDIRTFNPETFGQLLASHEQKQIKAFLLDQSLVSGLGNRYLQDILYRAKIHPARKISTLNPSEQFALFQGITDTIQRAIEAGGFFTETDLFGIPGNYHPMMGKHMLEKPCYQCKTPIKGEKIGRSFSYYCPSCQPPVTTIGKGLS